MHIFLGAFIGNFIGHMTWDVIKTVSRSSRKADLQASETKGN